MLTSLLASFEMSIHLLPIKSKMMERIVVLRIYFRKFCSKSPRSFKIRNGENTLRINFYPGLSFIGIISNIILQRNFSKKWNFQFARQFFAATFCKNFMLFFTVIANK